MTDAPPDTNPDAPPRRRRRWPLLVLGAAFLAAAVVAFVVLNEDDEDDPGTAPPVTSELPDPLADPADPDTAELGELLEAGRTGTHHARYVLADESPEAVASPVELEVWRDGGRLRQDTASEVEGQAVHTSSFVLDDTVVLCTRAGEADWSCAESTPSGTESAGIIGTVLDQLAGSEVTPRDDEIDGRTVRCFAFSGADGDGDLCVTPEGVPVRLQYQGAAMNLTELDDDVPDDAFEPPAEPVQADATEG